MTADTDQFNRSHETAGAAMALMQRKLIAVSPKSFWVWFEYCRGSNLELVRTIDVLISNNREFTDDLNEELYDQFFTASRETKAVRETGQRVQETLNEVLTWLGEAESGAKTYGETLESLSGELASKQPEANLGLLIRRVMSETREMAERSAALENRLQSSSSRIVELTKNLEEVRREAMTDVLTGIANRKYFNERLQECLRDAMENGEELCLLIADIDHFKRFNDTWGHPFGDQVLKVVARALTEGVKGRDTAARYGGEEFAIILPRTSLKDAITVAEHIRHDIAKRNLVKRSTGEPVGKVTLSLGVARFEPGEPVGEFLRRADEALYAAKHGGRNRVVAQAEPGTHTSVTA
ncbi:MAG TPA: GGDEF domain-containing protein [Candidatus Cybelea sp.]|nr:GGDEF domain-containing protein [Candidatus Cybelea sp.]